MKLWQKTYNLNNEVEKFTTDDDKTFDLMLSKYDVIGNIAHAKMLNKIGILNQDELIILIDELQNILITIENNEFEIDDNIEDVHSQIEYLLTQKLGEVGKKIHTARSRNDQVLLDIRLYLKDKFIEISTLTQYLFDVLIDLSNKNKDILIPGFTHHQVAMPSSFGLWFGAYAESIAEDYELLFGAIKLIDRNPLGSAAGFGSSFPIDRDFTSQELNFERPIINSVYCQMTRGKIEKISSNVIANLASTISRLANDIVLYSNQNYNFLKLPKEYSTGSSIMPHKQNPDVFELIRAKCNVLQSIPIELTLLMNNLNSGYHRDSQLTKKILFPAINEIIEIIKITTHILPLLELNNNILDNKIYKYIGSVEMINEFVNSGESFRTAYKIVSEKIEKNEFTFDMSLEHTHLGSISNLGNERIGKYFNNLMSEMEKYS